MVLIIASSPSKVNTLLLRILCVCEGGWMQTLADIYWLSHPVLLPVWCLFWSTFSLVDINVWFKDPHICAHSHRCINLPLPQTPCPWSSTLAHSTLVYLTSCPLSLHTKLVTRCCAHRETHGRNFPYYCRSGPQQWSKSACSHLLSWPSCDPSSGIFIFYQLVIGNPHEVGGNIRAPMVGDMRIWDTC